MIVSVGATGVCGTDVHIYEWNGGYEIMTKAMPVTIGHEFAGTSPRSDPAFKASARARSSR